MKARNIGTKAKNALDSLVLIKKKRNTAIILAGGSGERAGGETPKQHVPVLGVPCVARTVSVFDSCGFFDEIIVVCREGEEEIYASYREKYGWTTPVRTVKGGDTRFASAVNGFRTIKDETDFVYIHDAARCLVTEEMIVSVGHAACVHGAAYAAIRPSDTVRDGDGNTLDRDGLWLAQTPQVFGASLYRASAFLSLRDGISATDDVSLASHAGFRPFPVAVPRGNENIKLTYPSDFAVAEAILRFREEEKSDEK
ncbi:MAG: 2-C-methyl-D-erythritol 4-phosphate cytidylyltransferase [Clostridia bacterium]|nr:2-C-methyl-D-erythritol 4-phosphate cytidylyltransferase [Clostridia bacterium]